MLGNKEESVRSLSGARGAGGSVGVSSPIVARGPALVLAGCARRGAPGTYKYLTVYLVRHWSDFTATAALLFNFPVGGPMQSF